MEDHLKNKDRLQKEWEALCLYQAEPSSVSIGQSEINMEKNRYPDFVPCKSFLWENIHCSGLIHSVIAKYDTKQL